MIPHMIYPFPNMAAYPTFYQIYVGDLPSTVSAQSVGAFFSQYGQIVDIKLGINKYAKKFAFISFSHPDSVERALQNANNTIIEGTLARVDNVKNIKQINNETNIFFQNVPSEISANQVKQVFSKFGKVVSFKLVSNKNTSLGYGYVQFEAKDSAERCLRDQGLEIGGSIVQVSMFVPRGDREKTAKNNLYVKNFPEGKSNEEISQQIEEVFGRFGNINSKLVAVDKRTSKPYAFVCFQSSNDAENAKSSLNDTELFPGEEPSNDPDSRMLITWVLSRQEKLDILRKNQSSSNNVYTKNLKLSVTEEQIQAEFSKFGEIVSVRVPPPKKPTSSAFICFHEKDDALNAISSANKDPKIKELYENGLVFITLFQTKEQRQEYLRVLQKSYQSRPKPMPEKPEGGGVLSLSMGAQPLGYPPMGAIGGYGLPPFGGFYPPQQAMPGMGMPGNPNFQQGNMGIMQGQGGNPNKAFGIGGMGGGMPPNRKPMMDQQGMPKKYPPQYQQGGYGQGGYQQRDQMGGQQGGYQQRDQMGGQGFGGQRGGQPYRGKRGGPYRGGYGNRGGQRNYQGNPNQENNNYGNRQEEIQPVPLTRNNLDSLPQKQPIPPVTQMPQKQQIPQINIVALLKEPLESFMERDSEYQRNTLGTILYPMVLKKVGDEYAPKITGMLIDFDNFNVKDILEFIENETALNEVITQAENIVNSSNQEENMDK